MQDIYFIIGHIDNTIYESFCTDNGLDPTSTVFVFPGNTGHHEKQAYKGIYAVKDGGGLAKVAENLGISDVPTLSLATTGMLEAENPEKIAQEAIADLWKAAGYGLNIILPIREHKNSTYFSDESTLSDSNENKYELSFWGNIERTPNEALANYYFAEIVKLKNFLNKNIDLPEEYKEAYEAGQQMKAQESQDPDIWCSHKAKQISLEYIKTMNQSLLSKPKPLATHKASIPEKQKRKKAATSSETIAKPMPNIAAMASENIPTSIEELIQFQQMQIQALYESLPGVTPEQQKIFQAMMIATAHMQMLHPIRTIYPKPNEHDIQAIDELFADKRTEATGKAKFNLVTEGQGVRNFGKGDVVARGRTQIGPDARHVTPIIMVEKIIKNTIQQAIANAKNDNQILRIDDAIKLILQTLEPLLDDITQSNTKQKTIKKNELSQYMFEYFKANPERLYGDQAIIAINDIGAKIFSIYSKLPYVSFPDEGNTKTSKSEGNDVKSVVKILLAADAAAEKDAEIDFGKINKYLYLGFDYKPLSISDKDRQQRIEEVFQAVPLPKPIKELLDKISAKSTIKNKGALITTAIKDMKIPSHVPSDLHEEYKSFIKNLLEGKFNKDNIKAKDYSIAVSDYWRIDNNTDILPLLMKRHLLITFLLCPNLQEKHFDAIIDNFVNHVVKEYEAKGIKLPVTEKLIDDIKQSLYRTQSNFSEQDSNVQFKFQIELFRELLIDIENTINQDVATDSLNEILGINLDSESDKNSSKRSFNPNKDLTAFIKYFENTIDMQVEISKTIAQLKQNGQNNSSDSEIGVDKPETMDIESSSATSEEQLQKVIQQIKDKYYATNESDDSDYIDEEYDYGENVDADFVALKQKTEEIIERFKEAYAVFYNKDATTEQQIEAIANLTLLNNELSIAHQAVYSKQFSDEDESDEETVETPTAKKQTASKSQNAQSFGIIGNNIYSHQNNGHYQLYSHDINYITQSIINDDQQYEGQVVFLDVQQAHQGLEVISLQKSLAEKSGLVETALMNHSAVTSTFNINNSHWVAFMILREDNGNIHVIYKDSYGNPPPAEFKKAFNVLKAEDKNLNFYHDTGKEQNDGVSCGIFAIKNMEILAQLWNNNRNAIIDQLKQPGSDIYGNNTITLPFYKPNSTEEIMLVRQNYGGIYLAKSKSVAQHGDNARRFVDLKLDDAEVVAAAIADIGKSMGIQVIEQEARTIEGDTSKLFFYLEINSIYNCIQIQLDLKEFGIDSAIKGNILTISAIEAAKLLNILYDNEQKLNDERDLPHDYDSDSSHSFGFGENSSEDSSDNEDQYPDSATALHSAVANLDVNLLEKLIRSDQYDINHKNNTGKTALHLAIELDQDSNDKKTIIGLLIHEGGADISETDNYGNTALHLAASTGDYDSLEMLLNGDPECIYWENTNEMTALDIAIENDDKLTAVELFTHYEETYREKLLQKNLELCLLLDDFSEYKSSTKRRFNTEVDVTDDHVLHNTSLKPLVDGGILTVPAINRITDKALIERLAQPHIQELLIGKIIKIDDLLKHIKSKKDQAFNQSQSSHHSKPDSNDPSSGSFHM